MNELATREPADIDAYSRLDVYAPSGVAPATKRIDAIATISAGYREAPKAAGELGIPRASRDGTIFLHDPDGRAPGLAAALKAGGSKRLTIAFPFDDPDLFIQERFAQYTASSLKAYGDKTRITVITPTGQHVPYEAGSAEYAKVLSDCKVSVSVYFALADWDEDGPAVIFPDGVNLYRLRFTSRNSLRSIKSTLQFVSRLTKGRLAGIPFELALDYREVADPKGAKRTIPVWTITTKPPGGIRLSSRNIQSFIQDSLAQGAALMLPTPTDETIGTELVDWPEPDLDEGVVRNLEAGGLCDPAYWCSRWFSVAKQTPWAQAEARSAFIEQVTHGHFRSLKAYLAKATDRQASELLEELHSVVNRWSLGDERAGPTRTVEVVEESQTEVGLPEATAEPTPTADEPEPADSAAGEELAAPPFVDPPAIDVDKLIRRFRSTVLAETREPSGEPPKRAQRQAVALATHAAGIGTEGFADLQFLTKALGRDNAEWNNLDDAEVRAIARWQTHEDFARQALAVLGRSPVAAG